jgi:hypothetical protein
MVEPPPRDVGPVHHVRKLADVAESVLRRLPPDREPELLFDILRKMDLHPEYYDLLLPQARELRQDVALDWGDNQRALISDLRGAIPEGAHAVSSDPAGVRARLNRFDYMQRHSPDAPELVVLLAGVLIRLDRHDAYEQFIERVICAGEAIIPELTELVTQIDDVETYRLRIRDGAARALKAVRDGETIAVLTG